MLWLPFAQPVAFGSLATALSNQTGSSVASIAPKRWAPPSCEIGFDQSASHGLTQLSLAIARCQAWRRVNCRDSKKMPATLAGSGPFQEGDARGRHRRATTDISDRSALGRLEERRVGRFVVAATFGRGVFPRRRERPVTHRARPSSTLRVDRPVGRILAPLAISIACTSCDF